MPKDDPATTEAFYDTAYSEGFTTDIPTGDVLLSWLTTSFRNTEKDFTEYINVLRAVGLCEGDAIVDFGSSWGYGSWQFRRAGYKVYSYELNKARADYAKKKLSCNVVSSLKDIPERVRCLFASHVIEHLPDPNVIWETAEKVLTSDGFIACFCPNGGPIQEKLYGLRHYDFLWGKVHPLAVTPQFLRRASERHGFVGYVYASPYKLDQIGRLIPENEVSGQELCMIAKPKVGRLD